VIAVFLLSGFWRRNIVLSKKQSKTVAAKKAKQDLDKQLQDFFEKKELENKALQKLVDALAEELKKKLDKQKK
jgi:hypothetical protein